jgi:anti-anti-sigma regulatory factor
MRFTTRVEGDVTYIDLEGRLVAGDGARWGETPVGGVLKLSGRTPEEPAVGSLADAIECLVKAGRHTLVLNLAAIQFIDSAGLGEIVRSYSAASKAGASLTLTNLRIAEHLKLPWFRDRT